MTEGPITISKRAARAGLAVLASILLISGAAWRGLAADEHPAAHAATVSTPIQHAVAGSRDSYADVVDVVAPAVVTIRTEGKAKVSPTQFQVPDDDFFEQFFGPNFRGQRRGMQPRTFKQRALGSGVMVTTDGYLLTNYHVVDGADEIKVDFTDGRTFNAKVIGTDKPSDLALLKVNGSNFKAIALGNSDSVKVGDVVLAVGNPLGVGETVTMGIISAKNRSTSVDGSYEDFLQTDAPINHGNSGGALVNTKGELVGINSQILSSNDGNIGIGFAIPANMAKNVMEQLRTKGTVTRAQLGVTVQTVSSDMAQSLGLKQPGGVIVSSVTSGSAADRAGIRQGDVITSFDGQPVHDMNMLRNRVAAAGPGSNADLTIVRDGSEKHMTVKLDELSADKLARNGGDRGDDSGDKSALGVAVQPSDKGLVVQDVDPNGRAADAGIQQGDIIKSVNRQPVKSVDDLRAALKKTTDKPALLLIQRQDAQVFVTVRPANG
ncbi:MAG TPA: DegQ family serine endoprotease [Vicinamibacterales bacterium]|nr:DegQ family serine endoprotease [Vicinamibacterales bacterium]